MFVALIFLTIGFAQPGAETTGLVGVWPSLVIIALVAYVCGYQLGYGPISWVLIGECFPLHSRTRALGVAAVLNFGLNAIVTLINGPLTEALSQSILFGFFVSMCIV